MDAIADRVQISEAPSAAEHIIYYLGPSTMAEAQGQRNVSHSQLGDYNLIHQGSGHVNIHYPGQLARPEAVRVIPYPRNEDMVDRQGLTCTLNALLPRPQAASSCSAALWGLGGSGYTLNPQQARLGKC